MKTILTVLMLLPAAFAYAQASATAKPAAAAETRSNGQIFKDGIDAMLTDLVKEVGANNKDVPKDKINEIAAQAFRKDNGLAQAIRNISSEMMPQITQRLLSGGQTRDAILKQLANERAIFKQEVEDAKKALAAPGPSDATTYEKYFRCVVHRAVLSMVTGGNDAFVSDMMSGASDALNARLKREVVVILANQAKPASDPKVTEENRGPASKGAGKPAPSSSGSGKGSSAPRK